MPIESNFTSSLVEYYREKLPSHVTSCIEELASDPRNLLMVLSGQERSMMESTFAETTNASLAAEHGFLYKLGGLPGVRLRSQSGWQQLLEGFDLSWKETALAVMQAYTARTNASQIQNKGSALVWKFDEVDPEFGLMQAKELRDHLQVSRLPISVPSCRAHFFPHMSRPFSTHVSHPMPFPCFSVCTVRFVFSIRPPPPPYPGDARRVSGHCPDG